MPGGEEQVLSVDSSLVIELVA